MTIVRRLTLSYLAILTLLGCNLLAYLSSDLQRKSAFEELHQAIARQALVSSIQQRLRDYQKLVSLMSQATTPDDASANSPDDVAQFNRSLEATADLVQQTISLADRDDKATL